MELHIISSFHYDYIYLRSPEEYFEISFRILDKALEILEKEPDWCFTIEQTILIEEYLRRFPEKKEQMKRFVQAKKISFAPGMYVMPDMNMSDVESLCLQAKYGKKFLKETFGCDAKVCWIADCWGHHAQLPQILKKCGYEGYFFWRCMRRDVKKNDFYWQGLDKTNIFTHWLSSGYAGINFPSGEALLHAEELAFTGGTKENILSLMKEVSKYSEKDSPVLLCNGGDFRMPQETGAEVVRNLNKCKDFPRTGFSTPERYMEDACNKELPLISGEFNGSFQGTYSTNILIKQLLYRTRGKLFAKETFALLTGTEDVTEETWKKHLQHYFHDTVCGTICDSGLEEVIRHLRCLDEENTVKSDFLFNPLLRERNEVMELDGGKRVHVTLAPLESRSIKNFEEMSPLTEKTQAGIFENKFFKCSYDSKGRITSLTTAKGRELVNGGSPALFGLPVMNFDHGDNWVYYDSSVGRATAFTDNRNDDLYAAEVDDKTLVRSVYYPNLEEYRILRSEKECVIKQKGFLKFWRLYIPFTLNIAMDGYSPVIRYKLDIQPNGKYYRLRAAFPTMIRKGKIFHGIPCGIQERPCGEFPAEGFIHYGDEKGGIFLLNKGIPGNNVDTNDVMLLSLFRSVAMEYKCDSAGSFNEGVPHTFEYAILPHDGEMYQEENASYIEKYLRGCVFAEKEYKGQWKALPANIRLYSMRKHPLGVFLRLGEMWGRENSVFSPGGKYRNSDALENCLSEELTGSISFSPFEIRNIILVRQTGKE